MSQSEEKDVGVPPSLSGEHDGKTKPHRTRQQKSGSLLPSSVSMKSDSSRPIPIDSLKRRRRSVTRQQKSGSLPPSSVSMMSDLSMDQPLVFKQPGSYPERRQSKFGAAEHKQAAPRSISASMKSYLTCPPVVFKQSGSYSETEHQILGSSPPSFGSEGDMSMDLLIEYEQPEASKTRQQKSVYLLPSRVSMMSDLSMDQPLVFKHPESYLKRQSKFGAAEHKQAAPRSISASMKSDSSMSPPVDFKQSGSYSEIEQQILGSSTPSFGSAEGDLSMELLFENEQTEASKLHYLKGQNFSPWMGASAYSSINPVFKCLEQKIVSFVHRELMGFQRVLSPENVEKQWTDEEKEVEGEQEEERRTIKDAFLKITCHFLQKMDQKQLADCLQSKTLGAMCQRQLKSNLKKKFQCVFEGIPKAGHPTLLNEIYTELYITEGGTVEVSDQHEIRQIESASRKPAAPETTIRCEDIFKPSPERDEPIRTVMTKGVAGIGKTVLTQKFSLDWAEGKANQDIQFTFPFTFRELNLLNDRQFSLVKLVHHFFPETKEAGISRFEEFKVVFIFDGLDECRLHLDFNSNEILTDVTESTSVDVLLTNLIRGKLLPSAHIWITTRPAAASQIPPECVDMMTEVRGFNDAQKEEYFRKKFPEAEKASRIISHIKSQNLFIMCHIPVFCWITATVLEETMKTGEGGDLPKTLTEMYGHNLVVQAKLKNVKYDGGAETDPHWSPDTITMIESLGKLAFVQLHRGNLIFYESDLRECGIDTEAASMYSGVLTQIFIEERGLYQDKVYCFVHLSIQEFLAALHVHQTFFNTGVNLMAEEQSTSSCASQRDKSQLFYQSAVDKALQSPNGHLDLFLRFLLGLSLQTNQSLLKGFVTGSSSLENQGTIQYIKEKLNEDMSPERCINLFHCLKELNDSSLVEEIQQYLRSGRLPTDQLSPAQWSALVFILLSSEKDQNEFDLKKYSGSEEALLRLLPVVKASTKAVLSCCNLSKRSCEALASILSSPSSSLNDLDLSNNDLQDAGVKLLCEGLQGPQCTLETLRLSGCLITEEGCDCLVSTLTSNPSRLRELDLRYNHPGDSAAELLASCRLETLKLDHGGMHMLKSGLRKYACELTLDTNTTHRELELSENNRKVTLRTDKQPYPDHPDRFDFWCQVLCTDGLSTAGRFYWEAEREGVVHIAVTYKGIQRKGEFDDVCFGRNDQSWSLRCSDEGCSLRHDNKRTSIYVPSSRRVGVYLDGPAGTLSFYKVSSDRLRHLHTIRTTFSEPLFPAFRINPKQLNSSVSLCQIKDKR